MGVCVSFSRASRRQQSWAAFCSGPPTHCASSYWALSSGPRAGSAPQLVSPKMRIWERRAQGPAAVGATCFANRLSFGTFGFLNFGQFACCCAGGARCGVPPIKFPRALASFGASSARRRFADFQAVATFFVRRFPESGTSATAALGSASAAKGRPATLREWRRAGGKGGGREE